MSYNKGDEVHIEDDQAYAGEKSGHMRWVLGLSLLLVIALLGAIWIFGAFSQNEVESQANVTDREAAQNAGDGTDSIIMEDGEDNIDGGATQVEDGVSVIENE